MARDQVRPLTLQFYLEEKEENQPASPPSCLVSSETYLQSCPPHLLSALSCRTSLWQAAISFTAPAGVEAVRLSPGTGHWTREIYPAFLLVESFRVMKYFHDASYLMPSLIGRVASMQRKNLLGAPIIYCCEGLES